MRQLNLENVEEAKEGGSRLPAGGYVCKIAAVEDNYSKEYLSIEFDIANGKFAGHFSNLYDRYGWWAGKFIRSYKEKALPFFKGFICAVERSNTPFKWDNSEHSLVGKYIGLVLGEEEYEGQNGDIKIRLYVASVHSTDTILKGEFKEPEFKYLASSGSSPGQNPSSANSFGSEVLPDDDIPF